MTCSQRVRICGAPDVVSLDGADRRSELACCELTSSLSEGVTSAVRLIAGSAESLPGHDLDVQRGRN